MSQFKPGDPVRVVSPETSLFAGVQGVVDEVEPNKRNLTQLDSYTVRFSWGEKQIFWGAQLESVGLPWFVIWPVGGDHATSSYTKRISTDDRWR